MTVPVLLFLLAAFLFGIVLGMGIANARIIRRLGGY